MRVIALLLALFAINCNAQYSDMLRESERKLMKALIDHASKHPYRKLDGQLVDVSPLFDWFLERWKTSKSDTSRPLPDWEFIHGSVFQVEKGGVLLNKYRLGDLIGDGEKTLVFVKNYHSGTVVDGDHIALFATSSGRYQYLNTQGATRTVVAYDYGELPTESEIAPLKERAEKEAAKKEVEAAIIENEKRAESERRAAAAEKAKTQKAIELGQKALAFQLKRAEEGSAQAQYDLGIRYLKGDGVEANKDTAKKWLGKAAEQGHGMAKAKLEELRKAD